MKKTFLSIAVLLGWGLHASGTAAGEDKLPPADSLSFDLNEIVVTATRTPLMLKSTPVLTRVITARDLEKRGVVTLQQALEDELAGVEFHQAGYGSSMSFQGLDARYILFLVDGERMAGETYGNIDYSRIPMSNIARIEIVRGASSVLYGSNAMGAVVNIITRMPQKKVEVDASLRYGTPYQRNGDETLGSSKTNTPTESDIRKYRDRLDLPNLKGDLSLGFNLGKFKSLTTATYRTVDAYKLVGTEDEIRHYGTLTVMVPKMNGMKPDMNPETGMPNFEVKRVVQDTTFAVAPDQRGLSVSGWRDLNVGQRFDYELSDKFRFQLSGNYFDKRRYDFNGSILDENPMSNNSKPWTFESYSGYNVKGVMEHSPNKKNKIYLSYLRDEYYRALDSLNSVSTPKQRHIYNIPRLLWTLDAGEINRLTTGVEFVNEQLHFDLNPLGYGDLKSMNTMSVYVQDEILNGRKLSFVAGVRGDYSNRFGWSVTPKASAKYTYKNFSLRANYSNGYRTPSLKEMYMEFTVPIPGQTSVIRGNDKLKPEKNHYVSLAAEYTRDWLNVSATVYNSYFRNKIDVRGHLEGVTTILQYENINRSEFGGIELLARARLTKGLFVKADYNYIYQTDDAPESSTQYIFPSPHTATFQADYGFDVKQFYIGLNAVVRYVGPKNYEDFMPLLQKYMTIPIPGNPITMPTEMLMGTYSARHEGYAVCNAAVNVDFRQMVSLTIGVDNIFNYRPKVVNFNSAITPPRNMFIRVSYSFGAN